MKGKNVEKCYKLYESAMARKVSSSICNIIISIASMLLDKTLPINDVKTLEMELNNYYILTSQLKNVCGYLSLKFSGFLAILSSSLIVARPIDFSKSLDKSLDKSLHKSLDGLDKSIEGLDKSLDGLEYSLEKALDKSLNDLASA